MLPCDADRSVVDRSGNGFDPGFISVSGMARTIARSINIGTSFQARKPSGIATVSCKALGLRYPVC
jgi:hypothetical protein